MAYDTTYAYVNEDNITSSPYLAWAVRITAERSSSSSKGVTISAKFYVGFGSGSNSSSYTAYPVYCRISGGGHVDSVQINSSGTNWKRTSNSYERLTTAYTNLTQKGYDRVKSVTASMDYNTWTGGTQTVTISLIHNGSTVHEKSVTLTCPDYGSSSGGESGGGTVTIGVNSISTVSINPSSVEVGEAFTISGTASVGSNNSISGYRILRGSTTEASWSSTSTSFTRSLTAPTTTGTYTYYVSAKSGKNNAWSFSKSVKLTVTKKVVNPVTIKNYTSAVEAGGGLVYLSVTGGTSWAYAVGTTSQSARVPVTGSYTYIYDVMPNTTIYVWGYEDGEYSTSSDSCRIGITYTVSNATININPYILKDNLSTPDLVNTIQSGQASAQTTGGSLTYTWQYAQASTTGGLSSATWSNLGISGSSFTNLDMTQKVNKGYYYKIRVTATNSYGSSDTSSDSEIFQIPNNPGSPTFTKIIPKADPSDGYTEAVQEEKTYYGSGLFIFWTNPTISSSQLPISEIEMIYQSKRESDSVFGETKTAQFEYFKVLEGETLKYYGEDIDEDGEPDRPFLTSETPNGGGADLEVESLYETRIGIRITDTLGQYTDTFYTGKNYFKAESPEFGGNLVVGLNPTGNPNDTVATFRPFTCDTSQTFYLSSSVARSNSQDKLLYFIDCYVNDRKVTINLIDSIPISTSAFADNDNYPAGSVLYPETPTGDDDIVVKKEDGTTIHYEIKNSYFKEKLLAAKELRTPKDNLNAVYNDDFTDVVYKISVRDDFDSRSTVYNSAVTNIKYIEAPSMENNDLLEIGINRYVKSLNPFYDNSIILLNSNSTNNDRIVNPGESLIFKFKRAQDYNAADYNSTMLGDVSQYNIYVSRQDTIPTSNFENLNYTLLKTFSASLSSDGGDLKKAYPNNSTDEYYYLEYPLTSYQESKFVVFRIEAIDSKSQRSDYVYSNTYAVPCRATSMNFYINNVRLEVNGSFQPTFKTRVNDFGAAVFENSNYSYDNYPNYEREYSIGIDPNIYQFSRQGYLIFEGSLDGNFDNSIITLDDNTYQNYFSQTINLNNYLGTQKYPDILDLEFSISDFPVEWQQGIQIGDIPKIFFRATYKIAYGLLDVEKDSFEEKYLFVTSTSAPYSYYEDSPTVSYRNHQVGINTKDFSADSNSGQQEVLIIQDNGSYNLVVFKGAEQKIILNLTERTFYVEDNNEPANRIAQISFNTNDNNFPFIDGMTLDGGNW